MDYTVFTQEDNSFESFDKLYEVPVKAPGYKLPVVTLSLFLIVSTINCDVLGQTLQASYGGDVQTEYVQYTSDFEMDTQYVDLSVKVNEEDDYKVLVQPIDAQWQRQDRLTKLNESFYSNFDEDQSDMDSFIQSFNELAARLSLLKIEDSFVDVSRKKKMLDFNLILEEGLFLSVAKSIQDTSDVVMFSIARNHRTLVIDEMSLQDLINSVICISNELNTVYSN